MTGQFRVGTESMLLASQVFSGWSCLFQGPRGESLFLPVWGLYLENSVISIPRYSGYESGAHGKDPGRVQFLCSSKRWRISSDTASHTGFSEPIDTPLTYQ